MSFGRALGRRRGLASPTASSSRLRRRLRRPGIRRGVRWTPRVRRLAAIAVVVAGLLFGAWLWLRDSPLVSVDQVAITGESGAEAGAIRAALRSAARNMTTLDVQMGQLRTAVAPFPEVRRLRVKAIFPHRMVIDVVEQRPVAVVDVAGREVPVAADGTLLRAAAVASPLPVIPVSVSPVGRRLSEGRAAQAVAVLAAAPEQLLPKISQVTTLDSGGPVAQLRGGPSIYFGDTTRLAAKWAAATAVLADAGSAGATYIDVTDPARPAAGAGSAGATGGPASAASASTGLGAAAAGASTVAGASAATPATPAPSGSPAATTGG